MTCLELDVLDLDVVKEHLICENEMILQYLNEVPSYDSKIESSVFYFSDGFHKWEFYLNELIKNEFQKFARDLDIILIKFFLINKPNNEDMFVIHSFDILHTQIKEAVGNPILYNPYEINSKGSNHVKIPKKKEKQDDDKLPVVPDCDVHILPESDVQIDSGINQSVQQNKEFIYNKICDLSAPDKSWIIKARVINKQELRPFRKNQGEYFSVILRDESGKIRATFFKSMANYYINRLREGQIYSFTGGEVEKASAFNTTNNRFEIIFKENVTVTELIDEEVIPKEESNFTTLTDAFKKPDNSIMDIIAMVKDPGELEFKELKRGGSKELKRITLIDQGNFPFEINVWGETAHKISLIKNEIYLFKGLKIKTFNDQRYLLWENFSKIFHDGFSNSQYFNLMEWKRLYLDEESAKNKVPFPQ